jgi:hypothetical protein
LNQPLDVTSSHRGLARERGAAAVEFALVVPVLVLLLLGIIELGYIFNQQLTVSNAAREGARVLAITRDESDAETAAMGVAATLVGTPDVDIAETCAPGVPDGDAVVEITYPVASLTGLATWVPGFPAIQLGGRGVMPCGG